jgi:hypothetical protein
MLPITFVTSGLAVGAALAAVPVIMHLFMRQTPKHVIFPALQLVRERQKRSRKRLRIRNWLLLLARMALIALMALALARPKLFSSVPLGDREVPTAMALVFDTSLSMEYREKDKSRLDEAKTKAIELLQRTHESSQIFVIDSANPENVGLSPGAARKRIEGLTTRAVTRPMNASLAVAYKAVAASDRPRREVYVLTDLARSAWELSSPIQGAIDAKKAKEGAATYILRLAPKEVRDVAIVEAEPASGTAIQDEPVLIKVKIHSSGPPAHRIAQFKVDGEKTAEKPVDVPANGEVELEFQTRAKLSLGLHQGEVRLGGEPDPLEVDDHRFFSIQVAPPLKVLVISDEPIDADFVAFALEVTLKPGDPPAYRVERVLTRDLAERFTGTLKDYASIFLLNVASLPDGQWNRLNAYVHEGGGLVIGLGGRCALPNYNEGQAAEVVPAHLDAVQVRAGEFNFGKADASHPIFGPLRTESLAELPRVPIRKYMAVKPSDSARTILTYQNGAPALVERIFPGSKAGHVLLWTTSLSRRPEARDPNAWNEFPMPTVSWVFPYLMYQTVPYLAGMVGQRLNYEAGEDVTLTIEPGKRYTNFLVQAPGAKTADKLGEPVSGGTLLIPSVTQLGQWTVTATGPGGLRREMGFSVNPPRSEAQIVLMDTNDLDGLFGKKNYALADNAENLERTIQDKRIGREVFPWLMVLIMVIVTLENYLANRFYRERATAVA